MNDFDVNFVFSKKMNDYLDIASKIESEIIINKVKIHTLCDIIFLEFQNPFSFVY